MKRVFILMALMLITSLVAAAPVKNMPVKRLQPNGDTLNCFVSGDEFFHRMHDAQDYTIVLDVETGAYVYATLHDGLLVPTNYIPGRDNPASHGLTPGLMPDAKELKRLHAEWDVPEHLRPAAPKSSTSIGTLNNIVVFVRFSDESSCTSTSFSSIDAMFNDSSTTATSMFNYFWRSSYHNLRVITHYYPTPSGSTILSYQDSHSRSYYQPYSASNTNGYSTSTEKRTREFTLLENAVTWINANYPVSSSLNLDMDNDGCVDNICFILSGTYTGWNDLLWPHKWSLYDRYVYINGKRVYTFNLQLAGSGSHYFSSSTFCHEMTHTLSCPDIYNYYNYTSISPAGSWDLMCSNSTPPQQTNSLFKYVYLDWLDSIPELTDTGTYTMHSNASGPNHAFKIASQDPNRQQWYILEYRNTTDTFDQSIPNRGMLIWRYNASSDADNASFDYTTTPHKLWLFRPNSHSDTIAGSVSSAAFGVSGRTSFTYGGSSTNYPFLCDGTPDTTFTISDITISSDYQSVSFNFTPHVHNSCGTVNTFPLTEGFEDGNTGCWTVKTASTGNDSRIGVQASTSSIPAHSGSYYFRFSSYASASDYNQYLISPKLSASTPLNLKFYHRKSNSANEHFYVKYSTTGNNIADFTNTLTSVFSSSTSWQSCEVAVPQNAKYVAIDYCSEYLYYLYVDDIELRDTMYAHDTVYIYHHDTITTWIHDSVITYINDTIFHYSYDTTYYHPVDTIANDTSYYQPIYREVMVVVNEAERGKTSGNGTFPAGSDIHIAAVANRGYKFDHWMDGNTENPRQIHIDQTDLLFAAYFKLFHENSASAAKSPIHDTIEIYDTIYITLHDTIPIYVHRPFDYYQTITVRLPLDEHDTVYTDRCILDTLQYHTLTLISDTPEYGVVAGEGTYIHGTRVEIAAVADTNHRFSFWSDGIHANPRKITLNSNTTLTAYFIYDTNHTPQQQVINTVERDQAHVYTQGSTIVVESIPGNEVTVYNALGQRVAYSRTTGNALHINGMPSGFYAVKVGNSQVKKVIVTKH